MTETQETAESKKAKRKGRTRFAEKFLFEGGTGKLVGAGVLLGSVALGGALMGTGVGAPIGGALLLGGVIGGTHILQKAKRKKGAREKITKESEEKSELKKNLDKLLFEGTTGVLLGIGIGTVAAITLASAGMPVLAAGAAVIGIRHVIKAGPRKKDRTTYERKFARGTL